jgi:hypothetical protein
LYEKADSIRREIISRSKNKSRLSSLGTKTKLCYGLNQRKQYIEAEGIFRELLPVMKAKFSGNNSRCEGYLRGLIDAIGGQGRQDEAKELSKTGLETLGDISGEHKQDESLAMAEVQKKWEGWKNSGDLNRKAQRGQIGS